MTGLPEQATAYVAANKMKTLKNLKKFKTIKKNNMEHIYTDINGQLSSDIKKLCKDAEDHIVKMLEPSGLAGTVIGKSILNLTGAVNAGKIKVARLKMNRKPKYKAIKVLKEAILECGQQIMLLVIPAKVAKALEFEIEGFNGEAISEEELCTTVVVIDGQTRMQGYLEAIKDDRNSSIGDLYAYFPLNWINLSEMLKSINLKVFTWKNSDFMTGVLSNSAITDKTRKALEYIQKLESEGYNYTAACEWITLNLGIIRKKPLVDAMISRNSSLKYDKAEFGIKIFQAAKNKFAGKNESAIKKKTIPELIIDKWSIVCRKLSQEEATKFIIDFIDKIDNETLGELVSPDGYARGKGKKKEEFIKDAFNKSFDKYLASHPYSEFKGA